jgi:tripartite-type tricarboxylate transporter receptor subunit TctC
MTAFPLRRALLACAAIGASLACTLAAAQGFPTKPITLVVPNPPGGLVDGSARLLGEPLARILGQSVVIDNKGGASGNVAYGIVARAAPDGYTLLTSYSAYHVGNPSLFPKMPWAQSDLAPVALITAATNVIAVHPSVPAKNLQEFIAYLKKNPGRLSYASQGNGSLSHVGTEMFKMQTGTSMVHIPYRGSGAAIADVLSGQVQVFMTTPPSVMQHIQAGKLAGLAVTSKARQAGLPQVPTTGEAGLKGFELEAWVAIFAPAGTPPDVVAKLTGAIKQALDLPETKTRAAAAGIELRYAPPAELGALVQRETAFWAKTIQAAKITAD